MLASSILASTSLAYGKKLASKLAPTVCLYVYLLSGIARQLQTRSLGEIQHAFKRTDCLRHQRRIDKDLIGPLLQALQWSLDHPEELAAMGEDGYRRASSLFSWDAVTREHVRVFDQYLSKRRPVPDTRPAPPQRSSDG